MAYIYGPVHWKLDVSKHRSIHPQVARPPPESRMLHILFLLPRPTLSVPQRRLRISSGLHKGHEVAVFHVVVVDGEVRHTRLTRLKFVVPAEFIAVHSP